MAVKSKVIKSIKICICVLLAMILVVAGVLFFPLTGEKHTQIWSAGDEFDISNIQTISKERENFKILMFTDTQYGVTYLKTKNAMSKWTHLLKKHSLI